jgi:RNA polymerase sigma factor (sigma-70 family)
MKITAITKFKHGELFAILKKLGWSQSELARRAGVDAGAIGKVINLHKRPSKGIATAIQRAIGEAGEYLDVLEQWPETFVGITKGTTYELTKDIGFESLIECPEAMLIPARDSCDNQELAGVLNEALKELTPRERRAIEMIFYEGKTLQQSGDELSVTRERVRQIEHRAIRRLRHPEIAQKLEAFRN